MWKLSPDTEQIEKKLYQRIQRHSILSGSKGIVTLIEQLVAKNEPAAITAVASGLFSSKRAIHDASSIGVNTLLNQVPSTELSHLDQFLGGYYRGYVSEAWNKLDPKNVAAFLAKSNDTSVGGLLSFHKNGYVRHEAVRFLSRVNSGSELRFLLIRQNDWVKSIAEDAQAMVLAKLDSGYLEHFVRELDLLVHLLGCERQDLSGTVAKFVDLLTEPEHRDFLGRAIKRASGRTGRTFVRLLLERKGDHLVRTVRGGVSSDDPIVRTICLQHANQCLEREECLAITSRLVSDKFAPAREAAYELKASLSPSAEKVWKQCMFDKSRALRETAIFYLCKLNVDVDDLYRQELSRSKNSLPALSGLVSCGDASDVPTLKDYLNAEFPSRRAEAVRGIGRHAGQSEKLGLQKMLLDRSTRVVRATFNQLVPIAKSIDSDRLFGWIRECPSPIGVESILRLLMESGRWESLGYLIRGAAIPGQWAASLSMALMDREFSRNRVFTQPSAMQRVRIQQAIDDSFEEIEDGFGRNLASYLSSFGFTFPT